MKDCKYCGEGNSGERISSELLDIRIFPKERVLSLSYQAYSVDSDFEEDIPINYCPMCGGKLGDDS